MFTNCDIWGAGREAGDNTYLRRTKLHVRMLSVSQVQRIFQNLIKRRLGYRLIHQYHASISSWLNVPVRTHGCTERQTDKPKDRHCPTHAAHICCKNASLEGAKARGGGGERSVTVFSYYCVHVLTVPEILPATKTNTLWGWATSKCWLEERMKGKVIVEYV